MANSSLQLPKSLDVGFAVLTITPKSISVDVNNNDKVEKDSSDASPTEQDPETCQSIVGEICNDEGTKAEWFLSTLRDYTVNRKPLPEKDLEAALSTHQVYMRKGLHTFRLYAVEVLADVTPSKRRGKNVEKYSQAVAFEFVSNVFEKVLGETP